MIKIMLKRMLTMISNVIIGKNLSSEYIEKFVVPQFDRGIEIGISRQIVEIMVSESFEEASYPFPLPAMILRDKINDYVVSKEISCGSSN